MIATNTRVAMRSQQALRSLLARRSRRVEFRDVGRALVRRVFSSSSISATMLTALALGVLGGCVSSPLESGRRVELETYSQGHARMIAGDLAEARQAFRTLVTPGQPPDVRGLGFFGLGRCELADHDAQEALVHLRAAEIALDGYPRYPSVLIALAEAQIELDAPAVARSYLEKAFQYLDAGREREHAARLLALLYDSAGKTEDAQRYLIWAQTAALADYSYWEKKISPALPVPTRRADRPKRRAHPARQTIQVVRRARWKARATRPNVSKMGNIRAITIHHTGEPTSPALSSDTMVVAYMQKLQRYHQSVKRWADIGYHYLIDSRGIIWEGRAIRHQGAHAGNPALNKGNVGIALIGNFDRDKPTRVQVDAMQNLVTELCKAHEVPSSRVFTHQECKEAAGLGMTDCPGQNLEGWVKRMVNSLAARSKRISSRSSAGAR